MSKRTRTRKRLLLLGLILLLAAPLVLVLRGFVREAVVVPLLYVLWIGRLLFRSIPQSLLWALLLAVALLLATRSLVERKKRLRETRGAEAERTGRVGLWARRIRLTARGDYSRWGLAQHLGKLALEVLAHQERLSARQTRRYLETGELDVPPEIRAYLHARFRPTPPRPIGIFSRLMQRRRLGVQVSPLDVDPEAVVRFLEGQLEVQHER
jgi:hypothetical protein